MSDDPFNKRALIRYRLERARQTLDAAEILFNQDADSAGMVNRAYYAMFYAALAMLATVGEETSKHSGALSLFDKYFIKTGAFPKEMGKFLHAALDMRQTGDYEDKAEITRETAGTILEFASRFARSVEQNIK